MSKPKTGTSIQNSLSLPKADPAPSSPPRRPSVLDVLVRPKNWPFLSLHLACLMVLWTGLDLTAVFLCAACYLVRMFGITGGYHRYFSHRSYRTSRPFQFFLAWLGCSALQKGPLWWAGHHRDHHRYSDGVDDPHSPVRYGFWWSHIGWIMSPDFEATPPGVVRDLEKYPELRWLDRWHWTPGFLLALACLALDGWPGLSAFFISTVLLYHGTFTVNSLCHLFGRRRYETEDESRNNLLVALITLGEGWHNNHHHYQGSVNQGFFWWEIDVTYYVLRLLQTVGLVWNLRTPPPEKVLPEPEPPAAALVAEDEPASFSKVSLRN